MAKEVKVYMTMADIPQITHIDIIIGATWNIYDFEDRIKGTSEWRLENGEITNITHLMYSGKLKYRKKQDYIIAIIHSIQYDCPYHNNIPRHPSKEINNKKWLNERMKDIGFEFDL